MLKTLLKGLLVVTVPVFGFLFNKPLEHPHPVFNPFHNVPFLHEKISSTSPCIENPLDAEHLQPLIEAREKALGKFAVMKISALLPNFDQVGHKVLHANDEFVLKVLSTHHIPETMKKDLILLSIKMAQCGDDFGSYLLQMYYDIVDKSL